MNTNRAMCGNYTSKSRYYKTTWTMSCACRAVLTVVVCAFTFGNRAAAQCDPEFGSLDLAGGTFEGVVVLGSLADDQLIGPGTVIGGVEGSAFDTIQILSGNGVLIIDNTPCGLWTSSAHYTGELIVGTGSVTIINDGRASLGTLTTLDGGSLSFESPFVGTSDGGLELASGRSIIGFGFIGGEFSGASGSSVVATGPMTIGLPTGFFDYNGTFDVGAETVTLNYPNRAKFDGTAELTLSGGLLRADNGIFIDNSRMLRGFGTIEAGTSSSQRCVNTGTITPETNGGLVFDTILENRGATVSGTRIELTNVGGLYGRGVIDAEIFGAQGSIISATGPMSFVLGKADNPDGFETHGSLNIDKQMVLLQDSNQAVLGDLTTLGNGAVGGTLKAVNGILMDDVGDTLMGNGLVDAPVRALSGTAINVDSDGPLELGDGSASGFEADGSIFVNNSRLTFNDSNVALLGLATTLTSGVLEACNGLRIDGSDTIFGHGIIIGTVSGTNFPQGLAIANNPSGPVAVNVDLSLCANAAIYSQGTTVINGEVILNGFNLDAPNGIRVSSVGALTIDGSVVTTRDFDLETGASFDFDAGELVVDGGALTKLGALSLGGTDGLDPPTLRLQNSASMALSDLNIAAFPGAFASVEVSGSTLEFSDDVFVGGSEFTSAFGGSLSLTGSDLFADNRLQVWHEGAMSIVDSDVFVGNLVINGGQFEMSGTGSSLLVDVEGGFGPITGIHIGLSPTMTTTTIDHGGNFDAAGIDFNVGSDSGSLAIATVTGPDSIMVARHARIGNLGDGTLIVKDSASATFVGDLTIGYNPNSFGGVTIDGAGSSVTSEGTTRVGREGFGELYMTTGTTFHSLGDTLLGALAAPINPAPGFVIVDGGDWINDQSIYVGGDTIGAQAGGGQIFLKPGGSITNQGTMQVWAGGKLSLEGGDLCTRDLLIESASGLNLFAGSITVDGGQFRVASPDVAFGFADSRNPFGFSFVNGADAEIAASWHIGSAAGTFGTTTVSGMANRTRSILLGVSGNDLMVGDQGNGELDISDGGFVSFGGDVIVGRLNNGIGVVNVHGVIDGKRAILLATRNSGTALSVGGQHSGLSTGGTGDLDIFDGGLVHADGDVFFGSKPLSVGTLLVAGSEEDFDATLRVEGNLYFAGKATGPGGAAELLLGPGGLIDVEDTLRIWPSTFVNIVGGTIRANHLDITDSGLGTAGLRGGRIEANTVSGDMLNAAGTFAPGNSPADVILDGDYTQGAAAELEIELNGDDPGTGYDRLQVTGTATLDGTLRVMVVGDYVPSDGQIFTVLTYGVRVGEFSEILVDAFLNYEIVYGDNELQLVVYDSPPLVGDLNADSVISIADHMVFHACMTGPISSTSLSPACEAADMDGDLDVDMGDFHLLQLEFGNEATPRVVRWDSLLDGLWSNVNNWLGGSLPGVGQSAIINTPSADITVTLDTDVTSTDPLDNLLCNERLRLDGGTLSVAGKFQMNNTLELASGNIVDTTIDLGSGAIINVLNGNRPTLEGVTINGNMRMPGTSTIHVNNGLTLNGLITMNGFITSGDAIRLDEPNRMIDGNGCIEFLRSGQNTIIQRNTNGASDLGVLTIGPSIKIHGAGGVVGEIGTVFPASIVNNGTIHSDQPGFITLSGMGSINNGTLRSTADFLHIRGTWTNNGLVHAGGGSLRMDNTWINHGVARVGPGPPLESRADFTQSPTGTFITEIRSAASDAYGRMTVTGTANLDGILRIEFDATFVPTVGQSFTVLEYGDHIGEFSAIEIVGLDSDFVAVLNYKATNLEIIIQQP